MNALRRPPNSASISTHFRATSLAMSSASRMMSLAFLALAGMVVVASIAKPGMFENLPRTVPDFGAYYAAAVTNRHGDDPYNLDNQAAGQRRINPDTEPLRA